MYYHNFKIFSLLSRLTIMFILISVLIISSLYQSKLFPSRVSSRLTFFITSNDFLLLLNTILLMWFLRSSQLFMEPYNCSPVVHFVHLVLDYVPWGWGSGLSICFIFYADSVLTFWLNHTNIVQNVMIQLVALFGGYKLYSLIDSCCWSVALIIKNLLRLS